MSHMLLQGLIVVLSLVCASSLQARKVTEFTIPAPEKVSIKHEGGNVIIDIEMPLKMVKVSNNEAAVFTPILKYGTHVLKLRSVGIYGRTRYYQYIRSTGLITGDDEISFIRGTQPAMYQYTERISFRPWMENATLILEQKLYECCEEVKDQTVIALNAHMSDPNQLRANPSSDYSNSNYGNGTNTYTTTNVYYDGGNYSYSTDHSYNSSETAPVNPETSKQEPCFGINVTAEDAEAKATQGTTRPTTYGEVTNVTTPAFTAAVSTYGDTPSYADKASRPASQTENIPVKETSDLTSNSTWPTASTSTTSTAEGNIEVTHVTTPGFAASVNVRGDTPSYADRDQSYSSNSNKQPTVSTDRNMSPMESPAVGYLSDDDLIAVAESARGNEVPQTNQSTLWPSNSSAASTVAASNAEVTHVTTPGFAASVNVHGDTPSYASKDNNSSSVSTASKSSSASYTSASVSPSVSSKTGTITPQYLYYKVRKAKKVSDVAESDTVLIEFFQRSTDLNPSYRDNSEVLASLTDKINSLMSNPDVTMRKITLTTYSSPEGMFPDNQKMVAQRVESIKNYIINKCNIPASMIRTETVPENWKGLRDYVATHSIAHRDAILRLIDGPREPDNKEWVLKSTYADVYKPLLNDVYPGLRYTVVDFDMDIKKFDNPSEDFEFLDANNHVLPLDDIFVMAQQYPEGSLKSLEIYLKAVHYYATNRKANYNAAVALLQGGKPEEAKRYLAFAGEAPDVYYTRGLLYMALGDYQTARDYMKLAYSEGVLQAEVIYNYLADKVEKPTR